MSKPFLCDASSNSSLVVPNLEDKVFHIKRRGIDSGWINTGNPQAEIIPANADQLWQENQPICLPGFLSNSINDYIVDIQFSEKLYRAILAGQEIDELLDLPEYMTRFGEKFELLSTRFDEADRQELVSVDFDVMENGELALEDVWMRVSWLSFLEEDESLRFRFSFGMEGFDDVSLDLERQLAAAELCDRIFPESYIVCKNEKLKSVIQRLAGIKDFRFLERIVYYNAYNGGAQFHHDAEKGHLGVVYAQLTGYTLWLTLSKQQLMSEICVYLGEAKNLAELESVVKEPSGYEQLLKSATDMSLLESLLDDPANDEISELLNESPRFFAQLMNNKYAYVLKPGDVILLPQASMKNCAWHSVFCLGENAGQALSFAIKAIPAR